MENFFFFTDKQSWENQDQSNQREFGAIDGNNYRLQSTHKFSSGNPNLAVATCKSIVLIQEASGNPNLINIALKPVNPVDWEYDGIAYFMYRGIKKDSVIIPNPTTGTDFPEILASSSIAGAPDIKTAVIENKARLNADTQNPDNDPAIPRHLGYSYSATADPTSDDYVLDDVLLEEIFFKEPNDITFQLPIVEAGAILGEFSTTNLAGFEIIGDQIGFEATMGTLRASEEHILDVSSYSSNEKKYRKEEILNYFDPAAFYGNFILTDDELKGFNATSPTFSETLNKEVLLDDFTNKHKTYVDIRHQTGHSYNYFENFYYDNSASITHKKKHYILGNFTPYQHGVNSRVFEYGADDWPLFTFDSISAAEPQGKLPYYISFLNQVKSLAAIYPTFNVATPYKTFDGVEWKDRTKGHILERTILVYGKSILDVDDDSYQASNFEGDNYVKSMQLLNYEDFINNGEDATFIGEAEYRDTTVKIVLNNLSTGPTCAYYHIKMLLDFKPTHSFAGIIPRRIINPANPATNANLEESLLRHDDHVLDLMFPIFDMKRASSHTAGEVLARVYSTENAFMTSGTYGYYYDQRYIPRIGVAEDDNNLTFFAYIDEKNIYKSAKINNEREVVNLTSFKIAQQADFLFGLTKRDLNVSLQKQDFTNIQYKQLVFAPNGSVSDYITSPASPTLLFFLSNNSVNDGVEFELDYEYFDCITISKAQYNTLKSLKDTEFGVNNFNKVYLGVRYSSLYDKKSENTTIGRYQLLLKGVVEDAGVLKEKHVFTNIYIYTRITDNREEPASNYKTKF
ncbi:hypothetical protein C8N46_10958 [Kordia periserrulae]|uniref:Uncharacterized protein n=1 Tax=Kordia periserrulae TaxID=701523 RepID=A0A2T6BTU8_9FLAO|nr:hypothetical protein [Kordia periserrulae]PTX59469.1 hypothetical protein C8N46_10958 [Kordia periserrulae]